MARREEARRSQEERAAKRARKKAKKAAKAARAMKSSGGQDANGAAIEEREHADN